MNYRSRTCIGWGLVAVAFALTTCTDDGPGTVIGENDNSSSDDDSANGGTPPAPYNTLTFTLKDVDVDNPNLAAGYQGKLLRANDGTLYYAYLKPSSSVKLCDIAVFAGGPQPAVGYDLKVARKAPGAADFTKEIVPVGSGGGLDYIAALLGLDAALDPVTGDLVVATPGGNSGLFTCASSDLLVGRRTPAGTWSFQLPATGSGACCALSTTVPELCEDPNCNQGSDVGYWPAVAISATGQLSVAFVDAHNVVDQDGTNHMGYEIWDGGGVTGIRPWSGQGAYGALAWSGSTLISAFSSFNGGGLTVLRKSGAQWLGTDLRPGWQIGDRIQLAVAPNGKVGLLYYASRNASGDALDDLYYSESTDAGVTWSPAEWVDSRNLKLGQNPALAFDNQSRPAASYFFCGATSACENSGLRFAWRDDTGKWWPFDVHNVSGNTSGYYSSLVIDPTTNEPVIVFQDSTRGAAVAAFGRFGG